MSADDPFGDLPDGKTRVRPSPGGRSNPNATVLHGRGAPPQPAPPPSNYGTDVNALHLGINPLESTAAPLLALMAQLRKTLQRPDPELLRRQVNQELRNFQSKARSLAIDEKTVHVARYALCTAMDEIVLNTPWGSASGWARNSLLAEHFNEVTGGERFYLLLYRFEEDPGTNLHLLELMYACMSLGFMGKYRVATGGMSQFEQERNRLFQIIRRERGDVQRALAVHWRGVTDRRNPLIRFVPLWVVGALGAVFLLATYAWFNYNLNQASDPVMTQLSALGRNIHLPNREPLKVVVQSPPPKQPEQLTLRQLLASDIQQGLVAIKENHERALVTIRGRELFKSGSTTLGRSYHAVFERIGDALRQIEGRVEVTGHTDSIPIRTIRFPSNWHLSQARAEAVSKVLAQRLRSSRIVAEGRADDSPVMSNETAEGRALNRRVEILLTKSHKEV